MITVPVKKRNMKKIFLFSIFLAITGSSCKKLLDKTPTDFLSPENYFNTEKDANLALIGVYDQLASNNFYGGTFVVRMMVSDESYTTLNIAGSWNNDFTASEGAILNLWRVFYTGIERANTLLANLPKVQMDSIKKAPIRGEALFLRAYYHYMAADLFGAVPLKIAPTTSVNDIDWPRTPVQEVYAQVIKDMTEAEGLVLGASEIGHGGRVSRSTVQGTLARVCLTMAGEPLKDASRWEEAKKWALKVIESGEHRLNPDYTNIFINLAADKYDVKECIWEAEKFGTNAANNPEHGLIGSLNGISGGDIPFGYSFGQVNMTRKLFDLFADGDLRRDWNIAPFIYTANGASKSFWSATQIYERKEGKYRREYEVVTPKMRDNTPINFPILRYADVLLMYAEAENELNGPANAYWAINQVRARAYGKLMPGATDPTAADLSGLDQTSFRQAIQDERARELTSEAIRRHDLIRWGIYVSAVKEVGTDIMNTAPANLKYGAASANNTSQRNVLFPIPAVEISLNTAGMVQNPGW